MENVCQCTAEVLLLLARKILSVKRHLAVTNVSSHWYYFIHTMEHDQRLNDI